MFFSSQHVLIPWISQWILFSKHELKSIHLNCTFCRWRESPTAARNVHQSTEMAWATCNTEVSTYKLLMQQHQHHHVNDSISLLFFLFFPFTSKVLFATYVEGKKGKKREIFIYSFPGKMRERNISSPCCLLFIHAYAAEGA